MQREAFSPLRTHFLPSSYLLFLKMFIACLRIFQLGFSLSLKQYFFKDKYTLIVSINRFRMYKYIWLCTCINYIYPYSYIWHCFNTWSFWICLRKPFQLLRNCVPIQYLYGLKWRNPLPSCAVGVHVSQTHRK